MQSLLLMLLPGYVIVVAVSMAAPRKRVFAVAVHDSNCDCVKLVPRDNYLIHYS